MRSVRSESGQGRGFACAAAVFGLLPLALLAGGPAVAHPLDALGLGSRSSAMGSAVTAGVDREVAAHYNPAGVVGGSRTAVSLGMNRQAAHLEVDGQELPTDPSLLWELGLAVPLPLPPALDGQRLGLGVVAVLPQEGIYRLRQPDDRAIRFPLLDGAGRRLVLAWALGWQPIPWLRAGAGAALLPNVPGRVLLDLGEDGGVNATAIDIEYDWSLSAGLAVDLPWDLELGFSYRQGQQMTIDLPVQVEVTQAFAISALVTGPAFFTPPMIAGGLAWHSPDRLLRLGLDLAWYGYSAYQIESPTVALADAAGRPVRELTVDGSRYDDVLCPRAGAEWWLLRWLALRGGYGYHPTPVPAQRGVTNLLDGDRHVFALGLGVKLPDLGSWAPGPLFVDLHGQVQWMEPVAWEKEEILVGNAGYPTLTGRGAVSALGLTLRVAP